jgi:hypothetical protein
MNGLQALFFTFQKALPKELKFRSKKRFHFLQVSIRSDKLLLKRKKLSKGSGT